ncbi:alpha/beta fold hydrolase [Streptomyces sp. AV19]|uniref:esterase/lipase family protein n=1 Tax=Streptomyces sp. AV19 TaxID=2793068 RepID=UPI0018FE1E66|nr:alpha/beta fold hydrolase [Streptomyces sp. AV19]MBH1935809.1 alpha/beta fold hydrolase [Streptomyces sp. AV19]MDG4536111.1 alpha/beta fold hydrolase [Streptomyces sp. AV19]
MPKSKRPFRIFASALSALALALSLGTASAAAATPGATVVSSGWNNYSCRPSTAHPRPVVLVHGTFENAAQNWAVLAPYLVKRGYCVFSLDYGQLPGVPFFHGLGPMAKSAGQLSAFVDKVRTATGTEKVDIVGHSQGGGAMPRYYLKFLGGAAKVNQLVGIAPSHHGTTTSGLGSLVSAIPGARKVVGALVPAAEEQLIGSEFMRKLNAGGDTEPGVRYTNIVTKYDEVVTPYKTQFLSGPDVRNVVVQDLCRFDISEHLLVGTVDGVAFHEVANALDPAHATPTTCAAAGLR